MTFIETGRRAFEIGGKVFEALKNGLGPMPHSYRTIAEFFLDEATGEWYGSLLAIANPHPYTLRPYEVQFYPLRFYMPDTPPFQIHRIVTGELFAAFKQLLPSSDKAYSYRVLEPKTASLASISYYVSTRERIIDASVGGDIVESVSGEVGRYGVGILDGGSQARIIIFPPGYDHNIGYTRAGVDIVQSHFSGRFNAEEIRLSPKGEFPRPIGEVNQIEVEDIGMRFPRDPNSQRRFRRRLIEDGGYWEAIAA